MTPILSPLTIPTAATGPRLSHFPAQAPPVSVSLPSPAEGARNRTLGGAALFQAPSRRRIPRLGCMKSHPRRGCSVPSTVSASRSPPKVHKTAPSAAVTATWPLSRHPNQRPVCTGLYPRQRLPCPKRATHLGVHRPQLRDRFPQERHVMADHDHRPAIRSKRAGKCLP